jgi:hypothetical protein
LHGAAEAYASSIRTAMGAYVELPGHHLCSTLDLLASMSASTNTNSMEDSDSWTGTDFSGLRDTEALRRFLEASDYLLNNEPCNNDFIDHFDGYELSWHERGQQDHNAEFGLPSPPPVIFIVNAAFELLSKFSMSYF